MKDIIKYISILASLCVFFSCSLKEDFAQKGNSSVEYVARLTGFNNMDVSTKSAPTEEFETAVYTAYFLLFDKSSGNRIAFKSIDVSSSSLSQTVVGKAPESGLACFIANVPQDFANGLTTIDLLNSAVLNITYATYTEAGGYLGVPKLSVNGQDKLCIPMFGSQAISNVTHGGNIEILVKRLFAKISMNIKMQLTNVGLGQIVPSTVNYELGQYQLYNLPTKVHLMGNVNEDATYESDWVDDKSAFYANATTPLSSDRGLGLQTINISDSDNSTDNDSNVVTGIEFCLYVPEYYLMPKSEDQITNDQKYKPENYDKKNKNAVYLELIGEVNQSLIDNTAMHHKIFLGEDNTDNYTLKRNLNYINQITIKGIDSNDKGTGDNLDYRVTTEVVNNPVAQAGKAANCYIIAKPGEYTIPAYKGAYNNLNSATLCMAGKNMSEYETQVVVLANVVEYESITSITFSAPPTYDPETNTISFTVNSMLSNNWVPNGSVIMALQYRKKGTTTWTTEWSWHLWFVYNITASEDGWGTIGYQSMPDGVNDMMDRNLGVHALTNADTKVGFYYKYGEHAPYLDPDGDGVYTQFGGGKVGDSDPIWNDNGKSVTDPCPPGYRVPTSNVWYDSKQDNMSISNTSFTYRPAISLQGVSLDPIYYPISGHMYMDANNNYQSDKSKIIKNQDSYINLPIEVVKRGDKGKKNSYRFINIVTNEKIVDNFGLALGANTTGNLYYANRQTEKTSKGIQYNLGTAKGYTALTGIDWDNTVLTMTIDKFKSDFYGQYIMLEAYKEILQGMENIFTSEIVYTNTESIDLNNGYQVRCVSETPPKQ